MGAPTCETIGAFYTAETDVDILTKHVTKVSRRCSFFFFEQQRTTVEIRIEAEWEFLNNFRPTPLTHYWVMSSSSSRLMISCCLFMRSFLTELRALLCELVWNQIQRSKSDQVELRLALGVWRNAAITACQYKFHFISIVDAKRDTSTRWEFEKKSTLRKKLNRKWEVRKIDETRKVKQTFTVDNFCAQRCDVVLHQVLRWSKGFGALASDHAPRIGSCPMPRFFTSICEANKVSVILHSTMTMTMTHSKKSNICQWRPGLTCVSVGVMTPRKKESVALMRLALLARCALAHC